jgi:(2Fe-2S) ferredoxin
MNRGEIMQKPKNHILVCASFRTSGEPQGACHKKGSAGFLGYLQQELSDRGMDDVSISSTGCLKVCDRGPAMIVYPQGDWYGNVTSTEVIDEILDSLEQDKPCEKYLLN